MCVCVCDMIYHKGLLSKHLGPYLSEGTTIKTFQNSFVYIQLVCMHRNCMYTKLFLKCFNNDPFSQIRSQKFCQKWSLIANQVTHTHTHNLLITPFVCMFLYCDNALVKLLRKSLVWLFNGYLQNFVSCLQIYLVIIQPLLTVYSPIKTLHFTSTVLTILMEDGLKITQTVKFVRVHCAPLPIWVM